MSYRVEIDRTRKQPREISLVPMINVIFLMLIFFIVAGRIEHIDILPVEIPLSEQSGDVALGEAVITLGRHDEILAGEDVMFTADDLEAWVVRRLQQNPASRFTVKADANMEAVKLIDVLQIIERAGAKDVVLAAEHPS